MIKAALISRSSMYTTKGGDTMQVLNTARELKKLGVEAQVFRASEKINYAEFDLLHFFNLIRPADHLYHIRKSKKPYVVSTIYLDYSDFDHYGRMGFSGTLFKYAGKHPSEYLKNIFRFVKKQDTLVSPSYLLGHKRAMKKVLKGAAVIMPNSLSEFTRIQKDMGYSGKMTVVPNGIDEEIFGTLPKKIDRQDKVICVAQIYGMKNQLQLIKVCKKIDVPLELIGQAPPNHNEYLKLCLKHAGEKLKITGFIPQSELVEKYASSKVHALPSWFETTGLSSLEAGAMGCNLVVGVRGDTREYFKNMAWYADAGDEPSLEKAILGALNSKNPQGLREMILENYTWQKAGMATLQAYETALNE